MKHRIILQLITALTFTATGTLSALASDEEAQIKAAVMNYFEGQGEASYERLQKAFHLKASMLSPVVNDQGKSDLKIWEIEPALKRWSSGSPLPEGRTGRFLNIHIMDGRLASVSFDSNGRFYDLLTLAKMDGEWKIINKAFIRQKN